MNFDLSGVGNTWVAAVRGTRALTDNLALEAGVSIARPQQTFDRIQFIAPEAQLQYFWKAGRVRPYAGGGLGFSYRDSDLYDARVNLTLAASGGARIDLSNTTATFGELRLRGIGRNFGASTAEWFGGVIWRL
jgi:outer membrane protein W